MMGEILQFLLYVSLALFGMLGEGNYTNHKVYLSWFIICWIILICLTYIGYAIFELILWCLIVLKNLDYRKKWMKD